MKSKELVCIVCPNGCRLEVEIKSLEPLQVGDIRGSLCDKGPMWAEQEVIDPMRTIASSVLVIGGECPLTSVRTDIAIPLKTIPLVMKYIKKTKVKAPVQIGDIVIKSSANLPCNIVATRNVVKLKRLKNISI